MTEIFTIGYERASIDQFDAVLRHANIDVLVDVRAVAISRRKGFSKSALSERMAHAGIEYVHLKSLGDPKTGREAAKLGDYSLFSAIYSAHLETEEARLALLDLQGLAAGRRAALMCFEADARHCHRLMVAKEIAKLANMSIIELSPCDVVGPLRVRIGTGGHSGEGLAAA